MKNAHAKPEHDDDAASDTKSGSGADTDQIREMFGRLRRLQLLYFVGLASFLVVWWIGIPLSLNVSSPTVYGVIGITGFSALTVLGYADKRITAFVCPRCEKPFTGKRFAVRCMRALRFRRACPHCGLHGKHHAG